MVGKPQVILGPQTTSQLAPSPVKSAYRHLGFARIPHDDNAVYQELGNVGASANLLDCSVESAVVESSVEVEPTLKYRIYMAFLLGIGFATLAPIIEVP